jgi:hypothetical protein
MSAHVASADVAATWSAALYVFVFVADAAQRDLLDTPALRAAVETVGRFVTNQSDGVQNWCMLLSNLARRVDG